MSVAVLTTSMVNEWQQRNSRRPDAEIPGSYSDKPDAKPNVAHSFTAAQEQLLSPTTTAQGISSSPTFSYLGRGVSTLAKQAIPDQTGYSPSALRQGITPPGAQLPAGLLPKHLGRVSGSATFPSPRRTSRIVNSLGKGNEEDETVDDAEEVESDEEDEDDDDDDNDDDDDEEHATKESKGVSGTGKQRSSLSKAKRFRLTHNQTRFLMGEFARQTHPDGAQRRRLSKEIPGLSPRQVQVWFQNRRAKLKRLTVEDREKMMKSRALPEDFDISHTLRSPFATDASKDFSAQRQAALLSPNRSSTLQSSENIHHRSSIDASNWGGVPGEGYTQSPLSLATEFSPYLVQIGQESNPISSTLLPTSPEIASFAYGQRQQAPNQLSETTGRAVSFSSTIPGPSTQLHLGQEHHPQAQVASDMAKPPRYRRSPGSGLEMSNQSQGDTASGGHITDVFEMQNQQAANFANLPPEALAFWNTQPSLQSSPTQYYEYHPDLALQAGHTPLPQSFSGRAPLQINTTRPQSNDSNILIHQQASPSYTRTIHNTQQARPPQIQSPAAAYQTPISATMQGLPLQNVDDEYLLRYQMNSGKEIASYNIGGLHSPDVAESYQELQRPYKAEGGAHEGITGIPLQQTVYESPYQLSRPQVTNILPVTDSRYGSLARAAGFGDMPPTPQSAGLKRRYYEESETNPTQVSTSQKRRKRTTVSSAYKSQDSGQEP